VLPGKPQDCRGHGDEPERRAVRALREVQAQLPVAQRELRDLARAIAPGLIAEAGLRAAVVAMAACRPLPVLVDLPGDRFGRDTENAAYFMISEALTNAVKHSNASTVLVHGAVASDRLLIAVVDDGDGGADPAGHGLTGIAERIAACGGRLTVESASGRGTRVGANLPA
jgi:signal transduction histidine kinase